VHYLHGALHLFDAGAELKKYTWNRVGIPLLEQAREAMDQGMFPLFVAEGTSEQKLTRIKHSAYLHHSFKSLTTVANLRNQCFFVLGHSLAANDSHVLNKIGRGQVPKIYVSLHGDPTSPHNAEIVDRANRLARLRNHRHPLEIDYFDADTVDLWGEAA
jgi:hypothetical protein